MKQFSVLLLFALLSRASAKGSSSKCSTCKKELTDLKTTLLPQLTQDSTSEFLNIICESYPENERAECSQNITAYSVPILAMLENMNMEGVCTALGQCDDELKMSPFLDVTTVSRNDTTDFELEYRGMICAACTTTMSFLHSMLSDRAVQRTIVRVLTRLCYFTGPLRLQCLSFIKRYGTMILDLAETELTPKLCKTLHLCDKVVPVPVQTISSGMFCSVCKRVTSTVRFLIHSKDNERRVIALAKYMCHKLPSPFSVMVYWQLSLLPLQLNRIMTLSTNFVIFKGYPRQKPSHQGTETYRSEPVIISTEVKCDGLVSFALPQLFDYLRSNCQVIGHLCKMLGFCPRQHFATGISDRNREDADDGKQYPKMFFVPKQRQSTSD